MLISQVTMIRDFFLTLNRGNTDEVCLGVVMGMFLGLIPLSINSVIITLLIFILKMDKFSSLLSAALFASLGFLIDPLAHQLGLLLLTKATFLKPLWTSFYNMPLIPFTRFNNTIVMGNSVLGLILIIPVYFLIKVLIKIYRASRLKLWSEKIFENKVADKLHKSLNLWQKIKNYFGDDNNNG